MSKLARRGLGVGLGGGAALVLATAMSPSTPAGAPGPSLARVVTVSRVGHRLSLVLSPVGGGARADVALAPGAALTAGSHPVGAGALVRGSLWRLSYDGSGQVSRASRVRA